MVAVAEKWFDIEADNAANRTISFTYDRVGNLLSLTDPNDNTTTWQYDVLDRVTQETNQLGDSRYFAYDLVGNLTRKIDGKTVSGEELSGGL